VTLDGQNAEHNLGRIIVCFFVLKFTDSPQSKPRRKSQQARITAVKAESATLFESRTQFAKTATFSPMFPIELSDNRAGVLCGAHSEKNEINFYKRAMQIVRSHCETLNVR